MKLVDVNLLIYAVNRDAPEHRNAKRWFESAVSGAEGIGIAWIVVLAFLRITTRPGILQRPLEQEIAIGYIDEWLALQNVELVVPGDAHWRILSSLLRASGTLGNLTSDAHLAALALENGADIYSADYDFQRFKGIRHVNPLQ
jgi:toxin-antitoxin system PIN domain toxin